MQKLKDIGLAKRTTLCFELHLDRWAMSSHSLWMTIQPKRAWSVSYDPILYYLEQQKSKFCTQETISSHSLLMTNHP